jgi:hypothetical protein
VVRDNSGGLLSDGDLKGASIDTQDPSPFSSGLVDVSYYSGQLYTLEKNAPASLKRVNPADFTVAENLTYPIGVDDLNLPEGMARGAGQFYVADTAAGKIRKIDAFTGAFFSEIQAVGMPFKIRLDVAGENLYVTSQSEGKLYKFLSDLTLMSQQWVAIATSASDLALSSAHVLVSDAANGKIYVLRQSDGEYVYEFGSTTANNLQNPHGMAIVGNDLYIVERTNPGRVTRIRSQGW